MNSLLQVEIIDMHFGTGPEEMETMSELDPYVIDDHLQEIEICSRVSKSVFFIVSFWVYIFWSVDLMVFLPCLGFGWW